MTPKDRAARERKQKMFVVLGGLFLLALLAIQLPKFLGGSESSAAGTTTTATTTAVDGESAPPVDSAVPISVNLTDTDRPLAPLPGQLRSFGTFARKDPFVQQLVTPPEGGGGGGEGTGVPGREQKTPVETPSKGFTVGPTSATAVTVVSVNGVRQLLATGTAFPAADPVFVLVSERPENKSVVIGVAGGAYASGERTTSLKVGKPIVLVNTATGARYRLVLVAVGTGGTVAPTEPAQDSPSEPAKP